MFVQINLCRLLAPLWAYCLTLLLFSSLVPNNVTSIILTWENTDILRLIKCIKCYTTSDSILVTILGTFYQAVSQKSWDKKNIHSDGSRPTCDTMLTACTISPEILLDNITMIRTVLKLLNAFFVSHRGNPLTL